jgi:hypothetical protein
MKSHTYDFRSGDLARLIGPPLAVVALFAMVMHLAAALGVLP